MESKERFSPLFMLFEVILLVFNHLKGCVWPPEMVTVLFTLGPPSSTISKSDQRQI